MAEAKTLMPSMLSFFLVVLTLSVANGVHVHEEEYVFDLKNQFQLKNWSGGSKCAFQRPRSSEGATVLEMKHSDHCWGNNHIYGNRKQRQRLIQDDLRVRSLQSRIRYMTFAKTEGVSDTQIPLTPGRRLQTLNYVVTVELGGRNMTVIVDTGSDLTWVQCQPCKICYNQQDFIFDPSLSPTYHPVLCNSSSCSSLQSATGYPGLCSGNKSCNYVVNYGDGSYSHGDLGREDLKLGTSVVKNFVFGCGRRNKGLFGGASGLMGLGRSDISIVFQSSSMFGGIFSYCLPSIETDGASGSLAFGGNPSLYKNSTPISYTRMVQDPQLPSFYFINLTGMTVGGVGVKAQGFGGAFLIDSGTVISRVAPSIYMALKVEFLRQFSSFPRAPGFSILDTCFNLTGYSEVNIPIIKMKFEGNVELAVDVTGVFYAVKSDASQVCLALASLSSEYDIGIIGNYQQKNRRIIYDTKAAILGFAEESCGFE